MEEISPSEAEGKTSKKTSSAKLNGHKIKNDNINIADLLD